MIEINHIIQEITHQTQEAVKSVNLGDTALKTGNDILEEVLSSFHQFSERLEKTNNAIIAETMMIDNVSSNIISVQQEIETVAIISEQQAAATE